MRKGPMTELLKGSSLLDEEYTAQKELNAKSGNLPLYITEHLLILHFFLIRKIVEANLVA